MFYSKHNKFQSAALIFLKYLIKQFVEIDFAYFVFVVLEIYALEIDNHKWKSKPLVSVLTS